MKTLILLIVSFLSLSASAQFSVKVETSYLKTINKSTDKMLHRQNFHNAELVCDSLFLKAENPLSAEFLVELGQSYAMAHNWNMAIFSIIRQRALFPNDSLESKGLDILNKAALHLNFTDEEIKMITARTTKEKYAGHQAGWHNLITNGFYLITKKLDDALLHSYELYQMKYPKDKNMVLEEIKTIIEINIPSKKRMKMINREAENSKDWIKNLSKKQKQVFLRKEVKYYKKNKAKRQARISLKEYKAEGMNLWQSMYYMWNWIWI